MLKPRARPGFGLDWGTRASLGPAQAPLETGRDWKRCDQALLSW